MKIEQELGHFIICRGKYLFCFFVDDDGASWTSRSPWQARKYKTRLEAERDIEDLRKRAKLKNTRFHMTKETK